MTKNETAQILHVLKINYPQSFKNMDGDQMNEYLDLWSGMFANTSTEDVVSAVHAIIAGDPTGYAPNIGQINAKIQELKRIRSNTINEDDAWKMIVECVHSPDWYGDYKKLPQEIRDCVPYEEMKSYINMFSETLNTVAKAQFKKAYKQKQEKSDFVQALPESVKEYVGIAVKDLKEIEHDEMDPDDEKEKADPIATDQPENQ